MRMGVIYLTKVANLTRGTSLGENVERANTFIARLRGLIGRRSLFPGQGLILEPEQSIHSFFMRFPFDAVFVDKSGRVVRLIERMRPNRLGPYVRHARLVVELPAGTIASSHTAVGDKLSFDG